jgi:ubiquinone/menaquinone biosynthesis C-methylase UbiE
MDPEQAQMNRWSGAAPYWEKYREIIRRMFVPVTHALVQDAQIGVGNAVLDIATGPGEPALDVASLVGPQGRVVGIDLVPDMIAAARRASDRLAFGNTQFDVGTADHLPFAADTFDAVISRFGIMFFPAPFDAVREMLRVLKPGRKLALAVWSFAEQNPFLYTTSRILEKYIDSPPAAPDAPDTYRFASPGKLRNMLGEAGSPDPTERVLQFTIQAPVSLEEFWTLRCEMSEKLRDAMATLSPEQVADVKRQSIEALRVYSVDDGMSIPAEVLIVSGTSVP